MSPQDPLLWLVLIAIGLLTFGIRLSFIEWFGAKKMPPALIQALRFVPPAVLTAIIFPEVFMRGDGLAINSGNTRLIAAGVASLVALKTRNVLLTIGVGMAVFWILQAVTHAQN
jgi:branched-subunit amino acid transport protein